MMAKMPGSLVILVMMTKSPIRIYRPAMTGTRTEEIFPIMSPEKKIIRAARARITPITVGRILL